MTNVNQLASYIQNDLNILMSGLPGTGKTAMLKEACEKLGLKMKYYNAATLDPFTDLVGLPVPNHETRTTDYYRPRIIDDAEVVIMDEINRADPRTLNAIFELVQFKSINGEHLPNLRVVVAAMNPPGGDFNVDELDPALVDRFDIYVEAVPNIDYKYFATKFGDEVAKVARSWWTEQHEAWKRVQANTNNKAVYISPRRLELVLAAHKKVPHATTVRAALPVGATGAAELARRLEEAYKVNTPAASVTGDFGYILTLQPAQIRSKKNTDVILRAFQNNPKDAPGRQQALNTIALALSNAMGIQNLVDRFGDIIDEFSKSQMTLLQTGWNHNKTREFYNAINNR